MPNLKHMNRALPRDIAAATPLAHTVPEAVRISGIGRSKLYELIRSGALDARKLGGRTLIPAEALRALITGLQRVGVR
jgi:excisionase family DNA binding protein